MTRHNLQYDGIYGRYSLVIRNTSEYKEPSVEETLQLLQSSTDGLTESEVERRLQTFGFNEVTEKRSNPCWVS